MNVEETFRFGRKINLTN